MTHYRPYPAYQPSGIDWLGNIPTHWQATPLKYSSKINDMVLSENVQPDYEFQYVDIGSVEANKGIIKTEEMLFANAPSRARRLVNNGDTIISTVRTYLRAIAHINEGSICVSGSCFPRHCKRDG